MAKLKMTEAEEIGESIKDRFKESPKIRPGEDWDNTGFRKRVADILCEADYVIVALDQIVLAEEGELAKFQYRRTRKNFRWLKESILRSGVLEDITLQVVIGKDGVKRYYVVDGHTRLLALKEALQEDDAVPIPIFRVINCSDADAAQVAVELNRFHENFNDEDRQALVIRLFEEARLKQVDIAKLLGYSASTVSETISAFQDVPLECRERIESGKWTVKHGRALAKLKDDPKEQERIFKLAKKHRYNSEKIMSVVDTSRGRTSFKSGVKSTVKAKPPKSKTGDSDIKVISEKQAQKIHDDTLKRVGRTHYTGKTVVRVGTAEFEPDLSHTLSALRDEGYHVTDEPTPTEIPEVPSDEVLMDTQGEHYTSVCGYCGGNTNEFVAEALGFETRGDYETDSIVHEHCWLIARIKELQDDLAEDSMTKAIEAGKTYEQLNVEATGIFEAELDRRKQNWREENLPSPEETVKKGPKAGEPVESKQETDLVKLLERVRKKQPKLVKPDFFDAYEKYLKEEEGYGSQAKIVETLGSSSGTVSRAFLKVKDAIAKEIESK